jgi:hypothetical protein
MRLLTRLEYERNSCASRYVLLRQSPYERYRDSDNIVARLCLPSMHHERAERVAAYAHAVCGLTTLEPDPEKQAKYADFIDIYGALDDNELAQYAREYPDEAKTMSTFSERFIEQGLQQGRQEGRQEGEAAMLLRLLERRFGDLPDAVCRRVEAADPQTLLAWSERILTAQSIDEVLH